MFEIDHWKVETQFSPDEIGALFLNIDPREIGRTVLYKTIEPIRRRIDSDYLRACQVVGSICLFHGDDRKPLIKELGELMDKSGVGLFSVDLINKIENINSYISGTDVYNWIESRRAHIDNQKFAKQEIQKWLLGEGLKSKFDFSSDPIVDPIPCVSKSKWPWGDYTTKDLEILAAAAAEFWADYNPENPNRAPKSEVVQDWLITNHKVSEDRAYYMASILRADGLPFGRRPPKRAG